MYIYLDIVKDFQCEMCGTCCRRDWQVTLDEGSYQRNFQLFQQWGRTAEFAQAFIPFEKQQVPGEYAYIAKAEQGGCWFLEEDQSCRLHRQAGHAHLDMVCQTFPRYPMSSSRGLEITLSFSCPAVMKQVLREKPLEVMRSSKPPTQLLEEACVAAVFPRQQGSQDLLRYYFEIEHHGIDILQWRNVGIAERLAFLAETLQQLQVVCWQEESGQGIRQIINENYVKMEARQRGASLATGCTPEILTEHFLVNMWFKKLLYLYGVSRTMNFLKQCWQQISFAYLPCKREEQALEAAIQKMMDIELTYGHNRQALAKGEGGLL